MRALPACGAALVLGALAAASLSSNFRASSLTCRTSSTGSASFPVPHYASPIHVHWKHWLTPQPALALEEQQLVVQHPYVQTQLFSLLPLESDSGLLRWGPVLSVRDAAVVVLSVAVLAVLLSSAVFVVAGLSTFAESPRLGLCSGT